MANLLNDDYLRCTECKNPDFEEKIIFSFHKALRPREPHAMHEPLTPLEKQIKYVCTKCGHPLDK